MISALILSVVAPLIVATALVTLGHQLWRRDGSAKGGRWSRTIVPVLGAFLALWAVKSLPSLPPADASQWTLWGALVATAYALLEGAVPLPSPARWAARGILSALVSFHVVWPLADHTWSAATTATWVLASAAAIVGMWTAVERQATDRTGPTVPLALMFVGIATAGTLAASGTALLAQEVGGATATLGVLMVLGLLRPHASWASTLAGPVSVLWGGFLLAGMHYAEVPWMAAALVVLGGVTLLWPAKSLVPQVALAAAVSFAGLGVAAMAGAPQEAVEDGSDDYGYD